VDDIHRYVAFAIVGGWALLALWALLSFIRNRAPADAFWNVLGILQVILGVQVALGAVLLAMGRVPPARGPTWLHYVYGALGPVFVLVVAHRQARRFASISWMVFGIAALVNLGLTFRALQTGLGID
jgi:hypothetical protein